MGGGGPPLKQYFLVATSNQSAALEALRYRRPDVEASQLTVAGETNTDNLEWQWLDLQEGQILVLEAVSWRTLRTSIADEMRIEHTRRVLGEWSTDQGGGMPRSYFGARNLWMILVAYKLSQPRGRCLMTRKLLQPVALIGTVAAMLTVTIVLTLSHATVSMSDVGNLKCYAPSGIQKACWIWRFDSGDLLSMNERAHAVTHYARK
jgi:hypothetical protein